MINKRTILSIIGILILSIASVYSQTFPVTVSTNITPPYSTFLGDYVAPGSERLAVNIFLNDINRPELQTRLRLRIEGQGILIETKPEFLPAPLILQGGVPERLIASDLAQYFLPQNLNFSGLSRQQFERSGQLPEGLYQICFEVLEYNRGAKVSNSGCTMAWLILNDPPLINLPQQAEKLRPQEPQYVTFQWTPRHTGSPNSAFSTEYEFTLVELWPENRNPNDAILTSPPIYQTTTQSTTLIYGPAETPLELGRRYAFQVRAKSITGFDELDLFKNQGRSQVHTFQYGDACNLPLNIKAKPISSAAFRVNYEPNPNHTGFSLRYRKANDPNAIWTEVDSYFEDIEVNGLQAETRYEYQMTGGCGPFGSEYSPVALVTTDAMPEVTYACGLPPEDFDFGNNEPLPSLQRDDILYAGDFDVKVSEATGSSGTFTGKGTVVVPYLDNLAVSVEFANISVNTEYRMTAGSMDVQGIGVDVLPDNFTDFLDKLDETLASVDDVLGDISEGLDLADEILEEVENLANDILDNGPFSDDEEAEKIDHTVEEYREDAEKALSDAASALANGGATPENIGAAAKKLAQAIALKNRANKLENIYNNSDTLNIRAVEFYENLSQLNGNTMGLDISKHEAHRLHYNLMVLPDGNIKVPWVATKAGEAGTVKAKFLPNDSVTTADISFKSGSDGSTLTASLSGNDWTITLPSIATEESIVINAVDKKGQTVGKLNAIGYQELKRKVHIVPVGNSSASFSKEQLTGYLNRIYAQAGSSWEVEIEDAIIVEGYDGTLQDDKQALFSTYSEGMKAIINAYKNDVNVSIVNNEFYLFLVDQSQTGKSGYMPRKHQYGFIYMGEPGDKLRTIAHELGHGAYRLQHVHEEYPTISESTDNLMDSIGTGTNLRKYQWDLIHNPPVVVGLVEDLDEGSHLGVSIIPESMMNTGGSYTFITPTGQLIVLPREVKNTVFYHGFNDLNNSVPVTGALYSFMLNGETYSVIGNADALFSGYVSANNNTAYNVTELSDEEKAQAESNVIMAWPCNDKFEIYQFAVEGIPLYKDDMGSFLTERNFPVKPFSVSNTQKGNKTFNIQELASQNAYQEYGATISPNEINFTRAFCGGFNILSMIKVAKLRDLYNGHVEYFDLHYLNGQKPEAIELQGLKETNQDEYAYRYIEIFKGFIEEETGALNDVLAGLSSTSSMAKLNEVLSKLTIKDFELLSLEQRVLILKLSTQQTLYGNLEFYIRNLILSTPENDRSAFLDSLVTVKDYKEEDILLYDLIQDVYGLDGAEFTEVVSTLASWIISNSAAPSSVDLSAVIEQKKLIEFKPGFWFGDYLTEYFTEDGEIVLKSTSQSLEASSIQVDPYEFIYVQFEDDYEFNGVKMSSGKPMMLPALYAYLLFNNASTENIVKGTSLAIDVALFTIGIGEVKKIYDGGKISWRTYRAIADIGFSVADFTINYALEDKLKSSEEGQAFLAAWTDVIIYYSVFSVSTEVIQNYANQLARKTNDLLSTANLTDVEKAEINKLVADVELKTGVTGNINSQGLASYSNLRKYLSNARTKQYLNNQELIDLENKLKQAHPDVKKHIDEMDEFDFAEMVRGYRDLKNNGKLITFDNAIKSSENFYGNYGWLTYWKLTPGIKYSLTTIDDLKNEGKLLPTGDATDIQLASLQAFTRSGDFINVPMRYNASFMGDYAQKGLKYIEECIIELRKVPSRQVMDEVYSGKTYSKVDFESMFIGGTGKPHPNNSSYVSSSRVQAVAEGFIPLTEKWAGNGEKVAVIQRIISKNGVYIDDLSDWGEHLGSIRHGDKPIAIQRQYEVLLDPNTLKQVGEPIPIMENGLHKTIDGMKAYYVDFTQ